MSSSNFSRHDSNYQKGLFDFIDNIVFEVSQLTGNLFVNVSHMHVIIFEGTEPHYVVILTTLRSKCGSLFHHTSWMKMVQGDVKFSQ